MACTRHRKNIPKRFEIQYLLYVFSVATWIWRRFRVIFQSQRRPHKGSPGPRPHELQGHACSEGGPRSGVRREGGSKLPAGRLHRTWCIPVAGQARPSKSKKKQWLAYPFRCDSKRACIYTCMCTAIHFTATSCAATTRQGECDAFYNRPKEMDSWTACGSTLYLPP